MEDKHVLSQQKQSETLQQARSALKDHKKWLSQKKGTVAPLKPQSVSTQKSFNDEIERLISASPLPRQSEESSRGSRTLAETDVRASSDTVDEGLQPGSKLSRKTAGNSRPKNEKTGKKRKKGSVVPAVVGGVTGRDAEVGSSTTAPEEKRTELSSSHEKKKERDSGTQVKSPRKAKAPSSSRVLSVTPAPQSLQADLLDTTDTTLQKTEKHGRLAQLNFQTIMERQDSPGLQELKLALASVRGDADMHTLQDANLKDVLPLIKDHVTREVYLRYVAALNGEDEEEHTPSWSKASSEANLSEVDHKGKHRNQRILNVGGVEDRDTVDNVLCVSHMSSEDSDEDDTIFSKVNVKGNKGETPPMSNTSPMKIQIEGKGKVSPRSVRVGSQQEIRENKRSSSKLITSTTSQSPKYITVPSSSRDPSHTSKYKDGGSPLQISVSSLQSDDGSGNRGKSDLSTAVQQSTGPTPSPTMGRYPERITVSSRGEERGHQTSSTTASSLRDLEVEGELSGEEDNRQPFLAGREVHLNDPTASGHPLSTSNTVTPRLFTTGHTPSVSKDFPRRLDVSTMEQPMNKDDEKRENYQTEGRGGVLSPEYGGVTPEAGHGSVSKVYSVSTSGHSSSLMKDYPHKVDVSASVSGEHEKEKTVLEARSELLDKKTNPSELPSSQATADQKMKTSTGHSPSLVKDFPRRVNISTTGYVGSGEENSIGDGPTGGPPGGPPGGLMGGQISSHEHSVNMSEKPKRNLATSSGNIHSSDIHQVVSSGGNTHEHINRDYPNKLPVSPLSSGEGGPQSHRPANTDDNPSHDGNNAQLIGSKLQGSPIAHDVSSEANHEMMNNISGVSLRPGDTNDRVFPNTLTTPTSGLVEDGSGTASIEKSRFYDNIGEDVSEEDDSTEEELKLLKKKAKKSPKEKKTNRKGDPTSTLVPLVDSKGRPLQFSITSNKVSSKKISSSLSVDTEEMWDPHADGRGSLLDGPGSTGVEQTKKKGEKKKKKNKSKRTSLELSPGEPDKTASSNVPALKSLPNEKSVTTGDGEHKSNTPDSVSVTGGDIGDTGFSGAVAHGDKNRDGKKPVTSGLESGYGEHSPGQRSGHSFEQNEGVSPQDTPLQSNIVGSTLTDVSDNSKLSVQTANGDVFEAGEMKKKGERKKKSSSVETGTEVNSGSSNQVRNETENRTENNESGPLPSSSTSMMASFTLSEPLLQSTPTTEPKLSSDWKNLTILKMLMSGKRSSPPPPYPRKSDTKTLGPPCPAYGTVQPTNAEIVKDQLSWVKNREGEMDPSAGTDHQESTDGGGRTEESTDQVDRTVETSISDGNREATPGSLAEVDSVEEKPLRHPHGQTTALHSAARVGNMKQVKTLLRQGHHINAPDHNGWSPLMCCIHKEGVHLACADLLMREGANLDHQANDGSTALHIAGYTGNVSLLELLLMNGANPVIKDDFGRLPLHWSTKPDSPKSLKLLLGKDSFLDVDAMDNSGMTCLMWAAFNNSPEAIKVLLDRGAEVEEKDMDGLTTIHWAIHKDNATCLKLLLNKERTFYKDKRGCTILHRAAEYGAIKACNLIVDLRPDAIYDCDKKGRTPLHWAAVSSRVDVCAYLLEKGVDASIRDCHDMTALDYAREHGYDYVVALMVCDDSARLDFAKASRTTNMISRLNQTVPESIDAVVMTATPVEENEENSLNSLIRSPSINSLIPVGSLTTAKPGQSLQGHLGIFTEFGRGPYDRKYFWIDEATHSLCWAQSEKHQKNAESRRILSVHPGPSQAVRCRLDYSPLDVHKHTFRVVLDEVSVLDLVAFEEKSYVLWLRELGSLAVDTIVSRPLGQPDYSDGNLSRIRTITEDFEV